MSEPIISVSGLRGIVGDSLTPGRAVDYIAAFLSGLPQRGPVVLTRDGRVSGPMLSAAISSAVRASGFTVLDAGVAATPTTGLLVRQHQAVAGIQISASHNPPPYNGIKLFSADGRVISAVAGERVINAYRQRLARFVSVDELGELQRVEDTTGYHLATVLKTVNVPAIQQRKFKVVLDANHGAGAVLGRPLLEALGCDVVILGEEPHGKFAHPPEPTAANLHTVTQRALEFSADVVFCQDPDADRLAIIDAEGNYIGEEYTLALCLEHRLASRPQPGAAVVTNCSSSRMSADIAARHGAKYFMSAVGEANVTGLMHELQAVYGGEGNGGPIDPLVGYVRDSFAAMAQVLDLLAARHTSIADVVRQLPRYEIHKTTIALEREAVPRLLERLKTEFPEAQSSSLDGLRLDWPDRWLLVRGSNTEPIVRAIAEAQDRSQAEFLCRRTAELAQQLN